jgi:hypothetical protein
MHAIGLYYNHNHIHIHNSFINTDSNA